MTTIELIRNESNNRFNKIIAKHNETKTIIKNQFNQIYQMIKTIETSLNEELEQVLKENQQIYDEINNNDNNNNNEKILNKIYDYKDISIKSTSKIKTPNFDDIKQKVSNSFKLKSNKQTFSKIIQNDDNDSDIKYYNYDGIEENLKESDLNALAFNEYIDKLPKQIPSNIEYLWLMKGFNKEIPIDYIPNTVKYLSIDNIKTNSIITQIPQSITVLHLDNGFELSSCIPNTIQHLELGKINYVTKDLSTILSNNSSITQLTLRDGFNHELNKEIIPSSITCLNICNVKYPLLENGESIPTSINELWLCDGFNHCIKPGMLPSSNIKELYICDIKNSNALSIGSIPSNLESLHLCDGFSLDLKPGIIPNDIKNLNIYNINSKLEIGSIPLNLNGYNTISFHDDFNQPLSKGIIPETTLIEYLFIHNIKTKLEIGSIPDSGNIKKLYLCDGFSQKISSSIIPIETLEQLFINDINYKKINNN